MLSVKSGIFCLIIFCITQNIFAQNNFSVQANAAIISPDNGSSGLSSEISFFKNLNKTSSIYLSAKYGYWEHNNIFFQDKLGEILSLSNRDKNRLINLNWATE